MKDTPDILCIGSVLWDTIGRSDLPMRAGDDRPGRIVRVPGGVALNIAMALVRFGMRPFVLSVVGTDPEGAELSRAIAALGVGTAYLLARDDLPTDSYMAIESAGGLVAAIADAHSLEAAGDAVLAPLSDGRLGRAGAPYGGPIALDGNLTHALLAEIAASPFFAAADMRIAPASPGKADRLAPLLRAPNATLYLNLEEAGLLAGADFVSAAAAARALVASGTARAIVTAGPLAAADADATGVIEATPPFVEPRRVTGAGDTFMAAHIAAEIEGHRRDYALGAALAAAATYVSQTGT